MRVPFVGCGASLWSGCRKWHRAGEGGRCAVRWGCARLGCARGLGVQLAVCAGDAARRSRTPRMFGYTAVAVSLRVLGVPQSQKGCRVRALAGKSVSGMRAGLREAAKCRNAASKRSGRARGTARAPARAAQARAAQHPRAGICGRAASTCRHPSGETAAPRHAKASTSAP